MTDAAILPMVTEGASSGLAQAVVAAERERLAAGDRDGADAKVELRVMGFSCGTRWFAVEVSAVAEIVPQGIVVPMPRTPAHILGVTAHRGQVIAVVDLERLLGDSGSQTTKSGAQRLVVLRAQGCRLAVPASGVTDVIDVLPGALHASPAGVASELDPIDGCLEADGRLLSILKIDRLVERAAVSGG